MWDYADRDGAISQGYSILPTKGIASFLTGVATINLTNYQVTVGTPRDILVTVDISPNAQNIGGALDLGLALDHNSYVDVAQIGAGAWAIVNTANFPWTSNQVDLVEK